MMDHSYVQSPGEQQGLWTSPSIFLAGGITGCPDWQSDAADRLLGEAPLAVVFNPRRPVWDFSVKEHGPQQIRWEQYHLRKATCVLFWFAAETVQPISLLEYGVHLTDPRRLFVGVHPDYPRRLDVHLQTAHYRPAQLLHDSLDAVLDEAVSYLKG